ncbi:hypothetical protein M9H77_12201 [Catharanthus roseus]|uniref:Uncharacterized protein n=1 Tax=Catharanthus roseus TaxID=4058 RepID=A0ACC0BGU1_CATRO|nr:hypothetical protein M9H77_12201 [Catharanthus roseus]
MGCRTDKGNPCATLDLGLVALYLLSVILVWIYIGYNSEEMITLIGRRSMLLMWRSSISGDSTFGMTFFYPWRIYHHPEMITLDSISISRESTSAIQHIVILGYMDTSKLGLTDG